MPTDSSDDEDDQKIKDAIDVQFFNDQMFSNNPVKKVVNLKSNRHLDAKSQHSDINVGVDMQKRVGEKLSKIIDNIVKFVDVNDTRLDNDSSNCGVKLFSDSENYINPVLLCEDNFTQEPRKKIKKRTIQETCTAMSKEERIKVAVVPPEYIISRLETKHWKSRKKPKVYNYHKSKNGNVLISKD